jgi:hypothetical protein
VEDNGGVALGFGQAVTNAPGTIRCDSSSRGITCTDLGGSDQSFVIGDRRMRILHGDAVIAAF